MSALYNPQSHIISKQAALAQKYPQCPVAQLHTLACYLLDGWSLKGFGSCGSIDVQTISAGEEQNRYIRTDGTCRPA